jgi:TonB family protein
MRTFLASAILLLPFAQTSFAQEPAIQSQPAKSPSVTLPVAIKAPVTKFPKGAPMGRYVVSVAFVVDEHGVPRHPQVVQSDNEYFDFSAMVTALQWRFKPGMRDGKPVQTPLTVQLAYDKESKWSDN